MKAYHFRGGRYVDFVVAGVCWGMQTPAVLERVKKEENCFLFIRGIPLL